jgi:hypothetical protein
MSVAPTIKTVGSKGKEIFKSYILPIGAFAVGFFSAKMFFGWAAGSIAEIASEASSTQATIDISSVFGSGRNGILMVLSLILAGLGFYFFKDGEWMMSLGLFFLGSALATGIDAIKGKSWS